MSTSTRTFSTLSGLQRAASLCDPESLEVAWQRPASPLLLARGRVSGAPVALVVTDGHVRGGTIGTEEAAALAQFLRTPPRAGNLTGERQELLVLALDTGGVRVEEGPRALAATSAVGVLLAERSLTGPPILGIVSGPRGCFGALSVMAALPDRLLMTIGSHWGLTGPKLFAAVRPGASEAAGFAATSAAERLQCGDVDELVEDRPEVVREAVCRSIVQLQGCQRGPAAQKIRESLTWLEHRQELWRRAGGQPGTPKRRRRDLLLYSFRHQWQPTEPVAREGLVQAAWGRLAGRPALGIILGPAAEEGQGIGIVEATAIVQKLVRALELTPAEQAFVLNFVFCQGHVVDLDQERLGLPKVLAQCLRAYVAVRLAGHAIFSVLGGGTYGAAYAALAAPSHRILAIRGTKVAPMAPAVLRAFESLRGKKGFELGEQGLAEWIPDVRIVESIVRLPRALREEVEASTFSRPTGTHAA